MDVALATLGTHINQELDCVVEDACNVFLVMVTQVIAFVDHALALMVVVTVVCCTVDHMRNAKALKNFAIFCHQITAKIEEIVDDFRADAFIEFVLILFARSTSIVEIFIIELLWCDLQLFETVGTRLRAHILVLVSIAFTLALTAWRSKLLLSISLTST